MTEAGADVAQVSLAVANRIRSWRKEKKLSLDELSRRASVSKGMLVEIEKGAANPSIAILCKLAAALGVSVADIVNVSSEPQVHIIQEEAIPVLWQGAQGAESTQATHHFRAAGFFHHTFDSVNQRITCVNINTGIFVAERSFVGHGLNPHAIA